MSLLGLHRPGHTLLHRTSAGWKLLGLAAASIAVVAARGPGSGLAFLAVALLLVTWSGAGLTATLRTLRGLVVVALLMAAYLAWQQDWARAVEAVADLAALVLLATVLTVTTPIDEMLETITRALRPLRPLGVRPESVALAFSLVVRALPTTLDLARETREAALARGLQHDPRARLTPLVIRVVAHARATGDALHARGIGD